MWHQEAESITSIINGEYDWTIKLDTIKLDSNKVSKSDVGDGSLNDSFIVRRRVQLNNPNSYWWADNSGSSGI